MSYAVQIVKGGTFLTDLSSHQPMCKLHWASGCADSRPVLIAGLSVHVHLRRRGRAGGKRVVYETPLVSCPASSTPTFAPADAAAMICAQVDLTATGLSHTPHFSLPALGILSRGFVWEPTGPLCSTPKPESTSMLTHHRQP